MIDPAILALTGHEELAQAIIEGLTIVFILHPIAAALVLLALVSALPASRSHGWGILLLLLGVIAALVTTIVLTIDFTLIGEMRSRVGPLTDGDFEVAFGNCPWMVLIATVLLWVSVVLASIVACDCCGYGRRQRWNR